MQIKKNISLKNFNTFGVDVVADYFVEIKNEKQIEELFSTDFDYSKRFILGGGSNVLFTSDFDGLIIKNSIPGIKIISEDDEEVIVEAGAGVIWQELVEYCVHNNYWGIENLSLIPGTVGAAPIQNIGAYGQELKNKFHSLSGYDLSGIIKKSFNKEECEFGYRESVFKHSLKNRFLITSVQLKLSKKNNPILTYQPVKEEIEKRNLTKPTISQINELISEIRRSKLPDPKNIGNAGSFFKNPEISTEKFLQLKNEFNDIKGFKIEANKVKISAGLLIDKCGWKGKRKDDVASFEKQALVIVNYGNATGKDVLEFAQEIKESVKERFNVELKEEINII